jgi:hypothetical protein
MKPYRIALLLFCVATLLSSPLTAFGGDDYRRAVATADVNRLQHVSDSLRTRLQILERVLVIVVDHNPLVMSVETLSGRSGPFVISADRQFISSLSVGELEAAIAHELGHVWIYTHHPYEQSERLANEVALRVIDAGVFAPVYEKVWRRMGMRGNLADFISLPQD